MKPEEKARQAPLEPGCYLFKDEKGTVIYVGKAKILRNRVVQYFRKSAQKEEKGIVLARKIHDIEFVVTRTERDALITEYMLIKKYQPWFNVQHKEEYRRPWFIRIEKGTEYPAITITAEGPERSGIYLGNFRSRGGAEEVLFLLNRIWKVPSCEQQFHRKQRACLHYQTSRCMGPCAENVTASDYRAVLAEMTGFFRGRNKKVLHQKKKEMQQYIEQLEFEKAAECRELIEQILYLGRRCRYMAPISERQDMVIFIRAFGEQGFSVFYSRQGRVLYRQDFEGAADRDDLHALAAKIENQAPPDCENELLFPCLKNILADKEYIRVTRSGSLEEKLYKVSERF